MWQNKANGQSALFSKFWDNPKPTRDWWIRDRVTTVKELGGGAALATVWPESILRPKQQGSTPYTDDEINELIPAIQKAETAVEAPWPEQDPHPPPTEEQMELAEQEPEPEPMEPLDEGDLMESAAVVIKRRYDALSMPQVDWISSVVQEAKNAGVPIGVTGQPTARRVFIARALILACEKRLSYKAFESILQSMEIVPTGTIGQRLGNLGWERASVLAGLVGMAHHDQADLDAMFEQPLAEVTTMPAQGLNRPALESLDKETLKQMCRDADLKVGGTKPDLIERLLGE
jgi:hypothetical protein